jgi:hypothetical protein
VIILVYFSRFGMLHQEKSGNPVGKTAEKGWSLIDWQGKSCDYESWTFSLLAVVDRVTRLGEFTPIGWLFTQGIFF